MAFSRPSIALLLLLSSAIGARALGGPKYIVNTSRPGTFALAEGGHLTPLRVSDTDWPGVIRAAGDLRDDLQCVTGTAPELLHDKASAKEIVLIGPPLSSSTCC